MHKVAWGCITAAFLAVALLFPVHPVAARQPTQSPLPPTHLSPYWPETVRRWEPLILAEAERRGLDPDLIAAVIWKESQGWPSRRGPAGAVGLMMVMPKEAGFSWRPTAEQLMDPATNIFWGARALSIILQQSGGDLFNALAAYNGGWDQVHLRVTRRYAQSVLLEYARAVAVRNGLSPNGYWVATVAALNSPRVLTVLGPRRPLSRYTQRPVMAVIPDATVEGRPTAVPFRSTDGTPPHVQVGIWISVDGRVVRPPEAERGAGTGQTESSLTPLAPIW